MVRAMFAPIRCAAGLTSLAVAWLAPVVSTQAPPAHRGPRLVEVTRAGPGETLGLNGPTLSALAPMRDGSLFVVVFRVAPTKDGQPADEDLELWGSRDGGVTWQRTGSAPTRGDCAGAIVADGEALACLWNAYDGGRFLNVYHQRFDPARGEWLGEREVLAVGREEEDQYFASDLVATANGALVALIGSHRSPPAPWTCGWSTAIRCLPRGAHDWTPLVQANVSAYGCAANAVVRGDLVDVTYRTNPNEAVHGLRSFDTGKLAFVQQRDENIGPLPCPDGYIANTGVLCLDTAGGRTLLHVLGAYEPGRGLLAASYALPGQPVVTTTVAADPLLQGGNENPAHFALARGPAMQVYAYFAKASENFAKLWQCVLENGQPVAPAKVVADGPPGSFVTVIGLRCSDAFSGLHVLTLARGEASTGGVVSVFGTFPARTVWSKPTRD